MRKKSEGKLEQTAEWNEIYEKTNIDPKHY